MPIVCRCRRHPAPGTGTRRPHRASSRKSGFAPLTLSLALPFLHVRMNVVVVESPAKAKTINKYLGRDYKVVASYGHVRDLPAKDGSVLPDSDFAMSWEVDGRSEKHMKAIAEAVRGADKLFLATDPDREGEAISWHVQEVLRARGRDRGVPPARILDHRSRLPDRGGRPLHRAPVAARRQEARPLRSRQRGEGPRRGEQDPRRKRIQCFLGRTPGGPAQPVPA